MKFVDIKSWLVPGLIISLVAKTLILGGSIADSVSIGFLCGVYGVELWFYLTRRHQVSRREINNLRKELSEIRTHLAVIKMEKLKVAPQMPLGNVSWRSKN